MAPPLPSSRTLDQADQNPAPDRVLRGGRVLGALWALHVTNPYAWGLPAPALWFPAAGVGLCLVAWFGRRAALLILCDALLVTAQAFFLEYCWPAGRSSAALA